MNTNNKSVSTPTKTTRQRRATSGSSYIFAPSWLTNLNNKSGPSTTVLNSAYVSTEEKSVKEDVKGVVSLKKDGLGSNRQAKEGLGKDGSSSLSRPLVNGVSPLSPNRSRSRDFTSPRLSGFDEIENHESPVNKIHGRSRSVSQVNQPISSTSSSFDKNFPTLAKKKQMNLSVDLPTKNVENIWANSDTKSKLLSPTSTTPNAEEHTKFNIPNIDVEPELERRMSLVPKVEVGKLDGKRVKHSMKRKTSRSLSVDSVARGPNGSSVFGFGVGIGISNNRSLGQSQNAKNYLRDTTSSKPTSTQPQRQRAASISSSNGIKKASSTTSRVGSFGHSTISGRKSSIGGNSKNLWSNTAMGKMGYFKIFPEEEEEEEDDYEGHLNGRKEDICDHIEEEEEEDEESSEDISNEKDKDDIINSSKNVHNFNNNNNNNSPPPSVESEEKFLLQLGWQKPYNKDADSKEWAITDEEKRFFVKLIRALNGISISESDMSNDLSRNEIDRAKKRWAALVKNVNINGGNKIFNMGYQSNVTNQRHI